ncbi:MAG: hypothetical protein FD180_2716 [Planctomycetota bacterium]|nr:MAG: hypothetical protein FD180_2716 [Planctomycetota bacterium]
MSECACEKDFPPRTFKTASDADDYMSGIRISAAWRYVETDGVETQRERYRCRVCGADWACTVPPQPPYTWGPLVARRQEPREVQPIAVPPPFAIPVDLGSGTAPSPSSAEKPAAAASEAPFLEVGPHRVKSEVFTLVYDDEASGAVSEVLAALYEWRAGVWTWKANAGFEDIEIEFGAPLARSQSAFDLFAKTWKPELVNPGWRGLKGGKGLRPIHLRGIRKRGEGVSGFTGEYYLIVVDEKARKVVAWMMAEAK